MREDELHRQIARLVADHADRATPPPIASIRRRGRSRRARLVGVTVCVVLVLLASAVLVPRVLPDRQPTARPVPAGPLFRAQINGFEVPIPSGWKVDLPSDTAIPVGGGVFLGPKGPAPRGLYISIRSALLSPAQYPGSTQGERPRKPSPRYQMLDDRGSPLGHGRRPDGRPYVWQTKLNPSLIGQYAIAWPYHCPNGVACPADARWRVLLISGKSLRGQTTFHPQVARALRQLVDTVRPITNALPGGDLAQMDLVIIDLRGRMLLGSGGSGKAAWQAYLEEVGHSYGFELHFPLLERKPRRGVRWEAQKDAFHELQHDALSVGSTCLSWVRGSGLLLFGPVRKDVTAVRVELAGQPPRVAPTFGHDKPAAWAAYVTPPLPAGFRVVQVVALNAAGQAVGTVVSPLGRTRPCRAGR
jgi:hypothetical protein